MFITKRLKLFFKYILQFGIPIYLSFPFSPFDIYCIILITKNKNCVANELVKYKNDYYFKGLCKTTCYKIKSVFSQIFLAYWKTGNLDPKKPRKTGIQDPSGTLMGPYKKPEKPGTGTLEKPENRDLKKQNTVP